MADRDEWLSARDRLVEWDYTDADLTSRQIYHDQHWHGPDRDPWEVARRLRRDLNRRRKGVVP